MSALTRSLVALLALTACGQVAAMPDAPPAQVTLTVVRAGASTGTVTSSPGGITCGTTCAMTVANGTHVTLSATPDSGASFGGWSGDCTGTGACDLVLVADTIVTATFDKLTYPLTVSRAGTGAGRVVSDPTRIDCGAACTASFDAGDEVTLTATPIGDATFTGWNACAGTGACVVTMVEPRTVTATFTQRQYTLTVTRGGTGSGTVTSAPAGIACGGTCAAAFDSGTQVTLTATPAMTSAFTGWSGGGCTGTGTCTIAVTAAASVTAVFAACTTSNLYATQSVSINYRTGGSVYNDNTVRAYNNPTGDCGGGAPCDITGWLEFDLTSIPDTATLTAMTIHAYASNVISAPSVRVQYSSGDNWVRSTVTQALLPRSNPQVGNEVTPAVAAYNAFPITIGSQSWTHDLTDNSLTLGLDNTNASYSYAYFDGADVVSPDHRPYLTITACN